MKKSNILKYRIMLPALIIALAPLLLPIMGVISYSAALVLQVVGMILLVVVNLIWLVLEDIPTARPNGRHAQRLNRLPFIGTNTR